MSESGVLVVDKPKGMTSFDVVDRVRRARGASKAGHAGTLDPMATGVLVLCLGEATKIVSFLTDSEKIYRAEALFGIATDTQDAQGRVVATRDASALGVEAVSAALAGFVGRIRQTPPMFSAVHKDGRRLHELARAGIEVDREAREVEVRVAAVERFERDPPRATFFIACSKGTYVRTIAADLGERLGVGAHLVALRRLRAGPFGLEDAVSIDEAATAPLVPPSRALAFLPEVPIDEAGAALVRRGGRPPTGLPLPDAPRFRLVAPGDDLVAVAESAAPGPVRLLRVLHR
ncbi:MAG: tRNA pseudouridine(55) synthase TruB [Myxococcota bacterium]